MSNKTDPGQNREDSPVESSALFGDIRLKRGDQIRMLQTVLKFTDSGEWDGLFTYPNCGWDLVQMGLATKDKRITTAGRAALWLLDLAADPTTSKVSQTFTLPLSPNDQAHRPPHN